MKPLVAIPVFLILTPVLVLSFIVGCIINTSLMGYRASCDLFDWMYN